jgi:hypothetical protein
MSGWPPTAAGAGPWTPDAAAAQSVHKLGYPAAEEWSRAGWRAHLGSAGDIRSEDTRSEDTRVDRDLDALVERLGAATIPELAAESARRVPDQTARSLWTASR